MSKVTIKTPEEIVKMREAGRILGEVHQAMRDAIRPGISTLELDTLCETIIRKNGCIPSFKNYQGYPASVCISINDEVVHGIPRSDCILVDGDVVSLDIGVIYEGYHSDAARTWTVGEVDEEVKLLIERTRQSFFEGIKFAKAGKHVSDIGAAIQNYIDPFGYGIVRDLTGHGVGSNLHEEPVIPNFKRYLRGVKLKPGMTLAIEPMINLGDWAVEWMDDGWTVVTMDGSISAHYENTVLVTDGEPEILSLMPEEKAGQQ